MTSTRALPPTLSHTPPATLPVVARRWAAALALGLAAGTAGAQTVMVYEAGQMPTAEEVASILSRGASQVIKLRGLPSAKGRSPFDMLPQTPTRDPAEASAVSVPVHFEFDSAAIGPRARAQLDIIADGIRLTEGTVKVVIEGHTDAKGPLSYNERLSYRRAAAVRKYLTQVKKLPVSQLSAEGKGPHKPLIKSDPYSAANRRVQFRAG